jgi:hypothetical protein
MVYIVMETYEISENVWNTTCITDKYNFGSETKLCNISLEESSKLSENKTIEFDLTAAENLTDLNIKEYITQYLGPPRYTFPIVACLTIIYTTIFLTGLMGNLFTSIVILKNFYMRTVTNYYLVSLALSDILTLTIGKYFSCFIKKHYQKKFCCVMFC